MTLPQTHLLIKLHPNVTSFTADLVAETFESIYSKVVDHLLRDCPSQVTGRYHKCCSGHGPYLKPPSRTNSLLRSHVVTDPGSSMKIEPPENHPNPEGVEKNKPKSIIVGMVLKLAHKFPTSAVF